MAFLNEQMIAKMAHGASVERHPMLKAIKLDIAGKMAYLEGCILATLIDDGQVSPAERQRAFEIGCSIGLSEMEVEDCFKTVNGLSSDEEKKLFVTEMLNLIKVSGASAYFVKDFRAVLSCNSEIAPSVLQIFDWFGTFLFDDAKWQVKMQEKERNTAVICEAGKYLTNLIESQAHWPGVFDRAEILNKMHELGVQEHCVCVGLGCLVPVARKCLESARLAIPELIQFAKKHHSQGIPSYNLPAEFEFELTEDASASKLLNCLQCMEVLCCGDRKFSGARLNWDDCDYSLFSRFYGPEFNGVKVKPNKICWRWNDDTSEGKAIEMIFKFYSDLIDEYELRSTF